MKYSPKILLHLFSDAAQKAGLTFEHSEVFTLAEVINSYNKAVYDKLGLELKGKYLYESYRRILKASENDLSAIEFNPNFINYMVKYLDLQDFNQYVQKIGEPGNSEDTGTTTEDMKKTEFNVNIGKNINRIEGDLNNSTINNF